MNGSTVPSHIDWYAGALRKALLCGPFPLGCGAAGRRCKVLALRCAVGEAGPRERERSVAENNRPSCGTGPSGEAGVQGLLLHGSWRAPIPTVTNAELFGHAAFSMSAA